MKKIDLKAGYTLVDERGRFWYLVQTKDGLYGILVHSRGFDANNTLDLKQALNGDLTISRRSLNPACDIIKVYSYIDCAYKLLRGDFSGTFLLWERPKLKRTITLELNNEQIESLKKQGLTLKE